jgi:hypothetical protein
MHILKDKINFSGCIWSLWKISHQLFEMEDPVKTEKYWPRKLTPGT